MARGHPCPDGDEGAKDCAQRLNEVWVICGPILGEHVEKLKAGVTSEYVPETRARGPVGDRLHLTVPFVDDRK